MSTARNPVHGAARPTAVAACAPVGPSRGPW